FKSTTVLLYSKRVSRRNGARVGTGFWQSAAVTVPAAPPWPPLGTALPPLPLAEPGGLPPLPVSPPVPGISGSPGLEPAVSPEHPHRARAAIGATDFSPLSHGERYLMDMDFPRQKGRAYPVDSGRRGHKGFRDLQSSSRARKKSADPSSAHSVTNQPCLGPVSVIMICVPVRTHEQPQVLATLQRDVDWKRRTVASQRPAVEQLLAVGPDLKDDGAQAAHLIIDADLGAEVLAGATEPKTQQRRGMDPQPAVVNLVANLQGATIGRRLLTVAGVSLDGSKPVRSVRPWQVAESGLADGPRRLHADHAQSEDVVGFNRHGELILGRSELLMGP